MGPAERAERRPDDDSAFNCAYCRDECMIYRPTRFGERRVEKLVFGVAMESFKQFTIPEGWDACPVCVRRSEVEYGASE